MYMLELVKNHKLFWFLLLIFSFFLFYKIGGASINNDAQFWYSRSQEFVSNVKKKDWIDTFQNPKPGVTIMWLSGFSLDLFLNLYTKVYGFTPDIYTHDTFYLVHSSVIVPLLFIVLVGILVFYFISISFVHKEVVLFALMLLLFQPLFIGLARNFHADASVTSFMSMSALTLLFYFYKKTKLVYLVLSGTLAGLALLSKSAAIFLVPYIFFVCILDYFYYKHTFYFYFKTISIWLVVALGTFYLFFPAMWVEPVAVLRWVFIDEGTKLVLEGRDGINPFWYYLEPLGRTITAPYLLAFLIGVFFLFRNFKKLTTERKVFYLAIFGYVIFYLLQMSLVKQKMDRYILPIFPLASLLGGYGIYKVYAAIKNKLAQKVFVLVTVFFASVTTLYYFPNYLLFPSQKGKDQFGCSLCSDVGDYLNSKPNSADLKIISLSRKLHRLQPYVYGKVYSTDEKLPFEWTPEYVVGTVHEGLPAQYSHCTLEKVITFRGVDYWNLYACKN